MMTKMFISDLHLEESRTDISKGFFKFMALQAPQANELYILGDLFELWLGDDHQSAFNDEIINTFAAYTGELFFMHGNRDFLLGETFVARTGGTLLNDPTVIDCNGRRALLMHGDSLCTDDTAYMTARKMLRDPAFQASFLGKSITERAAFASSARDQSKEHTRETAMAIMDVNQQEVHKVLLAHKVDLLIHGHTHRPKVHSFSINSPAGDQTSCQRVVLGDWDRDGWMLKSDKQGLALKSFPLN